MMLDQAKVIAELRDGEATESNGTTPSIGRGGSQSGDPVCEVENLRCTVNAQQAEIERLRAELVRKTILLL